MNIEVSTAACSGILLKLANERVIMIMSMCNTLFVYWFKLLSKMNFSLFLFFFWL